MQGNTIAIPLDALDEKPGPYTMSFGFDLNPMVESVRRVGLLNPPFIDRSEEGRVQIVAGFRRVLALKALEHEEILCIDLSGSGLSPSDKLLLNLHDNLATRHFNGVEKGMVVERLLTHFPEREVVGHFMPLLGLPAHGPLLSTYVGMGRLEEDIRTAFAAGRLSFPTVRAMLHMDKDSRKAFCQWFMILQFNFNQQSQLIDLVRDLAHLSNASAMQILAQEELKKVLENPGLNGPQKVKSAIEILKSRRLPNLVGAEKTFQGTIRDLRLPDGVRVHHSPGFESPDFRLEISFRDGKILRQKITDLASMEGLERIKEPWKE